MAKEQPIQFYEGGLHALVKPWNVALERGSDLDEK